MSKVALTIFNLFCIYAFFIFYSYSWGERGMVRIKWLAPITHYRVTLAKPVFTTHATEAEK